MQKNFNDFTVKELLDLGLDVEVISHDFNEKESRKITSLFEGTRQTSFQLSKTTKVIKAWKGKFTATLFVSE